MSNVFTAQLALWWRLDPVLTQSAVSAHPVHWHPVCCLSTPVVKPHNIPPSSLRRTHHLAHSPHHIHLDARIIRSLVQVVWWWVQKNAGGNVPRFLCTVGRLLHHVSSTVFKDRALFADRSKLSVAGCCVGGSEGWEYLSWLSAYWLLKKGLSSFGHWCSWICAS